MDRIKLLRTQRATASVLLFFIVLFVSCGGAPTGGTGRTQGGGSPFAGGGTGTAQNEGSPLAGGGSGTTQNRSSNTAQPSPQTNPLSSGSPVKDSFDSATTNGWFSVGQYPLEQWVAAKISVTGVYTVRSVTLQMYQVGPSGAHQNINVRIFSHNGALDQPGSMIGVPSVSINGSTLSRDTNGESVPFTGLNSPVTPGTYWIVLNADTADRNNYVTATGTNETVHGECNGDDGVHWTEFMDRQIKFVFYGD